jgi:two-component system NarL family sensor kinase
MSSRTAAWLAWSLCALSLVLTALCFLLIALNLSLNTPAYFFWPELTVLAVGYSVIGAIIASRLPRHPIGWICCAIGLIAAVDHFGGEYAVYALQARPDALAGGRAMLWLQGWFWMLFIGLIVFLLLLFPTGRLPSSRWRPFAWVSVAIISVGVIWSSVISPDVRFDAPPSPIQLSVLLLGLVAAAAVVVGRRGARGVERQQIKWLLYAAPIWFFGSALKIGVFFFGLR